MYTYRRRVHYYENDGMQVVHHANYVHWLEEARWSISEKEVFCSMI